MHQAPGILRYPLLICALAGATVSFALWEDAVGEKDGWKESPWFGWFTSAGYDGGWIYHQQHGWMWAAGSDASSVWLWSDQRGWWWTSGELFPVLYEMSGGWYYYQPESTDPRWLYSYEDRLWERDIDDIAGGLATWFPVRGQEDLWWEYDVVEADYADIPNESGLIASIVPDKVRLEVVPGPELVMEVLADIYVAGGKIIGSSRIERRVEMSFHEHGILMGDVEWESADNYATSAGEVSSVLRARWSMDPVLFEPSQPQVDLTPPGEVFMDEQVTTMSVYRHRTGEEAREEKSQVNVHTYYAMGMFYPEAVLGERTYEDIVYMRAAFPQGLLGTDNWFVKGVGLVKAVGIDAWPGQQITIELNDSSLLRD